ncbi:MAG: hypothetical protein V3T72_14715 [Thermoanaerobaculia bacterium]
MRRHEFSTRGLAIAVALFGLASAPAGAQEAAAEPTEWHVSRYGGMRAWLPESDFAPEPQAAPHMLMFEVTQYPFTPKPTAEQQRAGDELAAAALEAARKNGWFDFDQALADSYQLLFGDSVHYARRDFVTDDRTLDPERPEFLMFYDTDRGKKLVGTMFLVSSPEERGPQIGGPATVWHYHVWAEKRCLLEGMMVVGDLDTEGRCELGVPTQRSPEMMHVWFVDHPEGPFATKMRLPDWLLEDL